jgi:outer membrane lipoprotein SlyB
MNAMQRRLPAWIGASLLALAIPAAANAAAASTTPQAVSADKLSALCSSCAIVSEVKTETRKGKGGAAGVIGGAVVGGVIGHQIGGGVGKTLATVGGAAAGAYAGNEVQKNVNKETVWVTRVTLKDGSVRSFENSADPGFKAGDVVVIDGTTIKKR